MSRVLVWGFSNNLAGTEAVINNYVGSMTDEIAFDFLVYQDLPAYEHLFSSGKNRYFIIPSKSRSYFAYWSAIKDHFSKYAHEYCALWQNSNAFTNIDPLVLAAKYHIPKRIIHAHNSEQVGGLNNIVLSALHRKTYSRYITDRWACSRKAGKFFFENLDYLVLPNAISFKRYEYSVSKRKEFREEFGIDEETIIIGTIGRLNVQKNQSWLLELFSIYKQNHKKALLFIVGDGELREALLAQSVDLGVQDSVIITGARSDVESVLSAFDIFLLPSLFEGLPLSLLEAQANGLPCLASDGITDEAIISNSCVLLNLKDKHLWLNAMESSRREGTFLDTQRSSQFDLCCQVGVLETAILP